MIAQFDAFIDIDIEKRGNVETGSGYSLQNEVLIKQDYNSIYIIN